MGSSPISSSVVSSAPFLGGRAPKATAEQPTWIVGSDVAEEGSWINLVCSWAKTSRRNFQFSICLGVVSKNGQRGI